MIRFRPDESAGGEGEQEAPETNAQDNGTTATAPPAVDQWSVSKEEWESTQAALRAMASRFLDGQQAPPQPQQEDEEVDIDEYISRQVEGRLAPYVPSITAAQQEQGRKNLAKEHDKLEKELKRDFDRELAEQLGNYFLSETGDPIKAVRMGAERAIEIEDAYSAKSVEKYKASLKRGPHDVEPGEGAGGDRQIPAAKSYDEVIDRWAGQTEL